MTTCFPPNPCVLSSQAPLMDFSLSVHALKVALAQDSILNCFVFNYTQVKGIFTSLVPTTKHSQIIFKSLLSISRSQTWISNTHTELGSLHLDMLLASQTQYLQL
jgi:hypothetical protein